MTSHVARIGFHTKHLVKYAICGGVTPAEMTKAIRNQMVMEAMKETGNNQCKAAKLLGVHRNTVSRMLDELWKPVEEKAL